MPPGDCPARAALRKKKHAKPNSDEENELERETIIEEKENELYPHLAYTILGHGIVKRRVCTMSHQDREKVKLLQRLRKVRGQLDAVERSLTANEECGGQLMLLAAVRGGVTSLMAEVLETHIRFHLVDGAKEQIAPELAEDLIDLVHAYLK